MINITEVVQSSGWKNFMAKLYGWGASVVIIGAMFKINHWPGGTIVITLGLITEAIIFFFSAFEPLHEELDWTLVYPELAGISDPDEIENFKEDRLDNAGRPMERIENLLNQSGIDNEALENIGKGLKQLHSSASGIADISKATVATESFVSNIENAANSIGGLNDSYSTTAVSMKESTSNLSNAYMQAADKIIKSSDDVADTYKNVANLIKNEQDNLNKGTKAHEEQLSVLNGTLKQLNSVYENHIKESTSQIKGSMEVYSGLNAMIQNLKDSVDETNKYKQEISKLKESIASLNGIYGNMLNTMDTIK